MTENESIADEAAPNNPVAHAFIRGLERAEGRSERRQARAYRSGRAYGFLLGFGAGVLAGAIWGLGVTGHL